MRVTYQSRGYSPEKVVDRFVRVSMYPNLYIWCERGEDKRYDIRQGECFGHEVPEQIRMKADELKGDLFSYVLWPL